jgi:hypothetical protein
LQFVAAPGVHADLAPAAALAAPDEQRAAALVKIGLGERERFLARSPARHRMTISARSRRPSASPPAARITATISSTLGGSAG